MWSFLAGLGCAVVLAAGTLWLLEAGTVTVVERSDDLSTLIENVWAEDSGSFPEPVETQ